MSGHNKWSKIKRKKATTDVRKGKVFSKLAKEIELAAQKGADPEINYELRGAIEDAKTANMPFINIDRAIKKGSGQDKEKSALEEVWYGAYGPGGVAILIKTVTNNKNRTVAEIKHILSKHSSNLTEVDSVKWQFNKENKASFPVTLGENEKSVLGKLLNELYEQEDTKGVFTNEK